ncbi:helix-turn-helix domain protein [Clostridium sp. DL-VIII]|uniref:helix-turn-helix domain-containing protein n=1 Tax=Clostridium sp. DL-VIII TaxID=641107 RepID=UPI00023AF7AB|nr:helix-turn-helix transcriptional regulator [Clostridium sp. DL-VIII]EHI98007.1 helix-turn-helix domain protein [Clostridium sp. DL-VIII]
MEVYERLKDLRKNVLKLNQEEFSKNIGLSRSNIANIEVGRINLTDRVISDICKEFNVNENWLRTGDGDMFNASFKSDDSFIKNVFTVLEQLSNEEWALLKKIVDKLK